MNHCLATTFLALALMLAADTTLSAASPPPPVVTWGAQHFVNLQVGQSRQVAGHTLTLNRTFRHGCEITVDGQPLRLAFGRQTLPQVSGGLRIAIADQRGIAALTTDSAFPLNHAALQGEVLLNVSAADQPLLDPARYTFPIDRGDGYVWTMEEDSHIFALLQPNRSHEGTDLDLTGARHSAQHRLVAIEDSIVRWVRFGNKHEACLLLQSQHQPEIFYLYQHLDRDRLLVAEGDVLTRGRALGHIWGDGRWEHLHFSVIAPPGNPPDYPERYQYTLNAFPALAELWHGSLDIPEPIHPTGELNFAERYWDHGNRQHLAAYTPVLGYGWRLGDWCPAGRVERVTSLQRSDVFGFEGSALLPRTLFAGEAAAATNPEPRYRFEVRVPDGTYRVEVRCGSAFTATHQSVQAENVALGSASLEAGEFVDLASATVPVRDGHLTLTLNLGDTGQPASVSKLSFHRLISPSPPSPTADAH